MHVGSNAALCCAYAGVAAAVAHQPKQVIPTASSPTAGAQAPGQATPITTNMPVPPVLPVVVMMPTSGTGASPFLACLSKICSIPEIAL